MRVLGIFLALAVITALVGFGVGALKPRLDMAIMHGVAAHRDATVTSIAGVVTNAGPFAILAPLSVAVVLLRRWNRPADDIALLVTAAASPALPCLFNVIVPPPAPTLTQPQQPS